MKHTDIRPVLETDLLQLAQLERTTFYEIFQEIYSAEDMRTFLNEKKSDAAIRQEWGQPDAQYYILREGSTAIGFLKVNLFRQPDNGTLLPAPAMEIEKIYVQKAFQGKKLGKALMEYAYHIAAVNSVCTLWLGVWEHNHAARKFYEKEGFVAFGEHIFMVGKQEDRDLLLQRAINP